MKMRFGCACALGLIGVSNAAAGTFLWESNYGSELFDLRGRDDAAQQVAIGFDFSFAGLVTRNLWVGTNGGIGVGGLGEANDYPSGNEFLFTDSPMISPFWSDLSLTGQGRVYFNDFGDRAVITWVGVGSYAEPFTSNTFQVQIDNTGEIVFGYAGLERNIASNFDTDIHVGLTTGGLSSWPNEVDYTADTPVHTGATVLELFGYDDDDLDIDFTNIIFEPDGAGGYFVSVPAPGGAGVLLLGLGAARRRR